MDIKSKTVADTAPLHIKDASGDFLYSDAERTKPVLIHVYGPGSKAFAAMEARRDARNLKRMQENGGQWTAADGEERVKELAEDMASLTVRFENFSYSPAGDAEGTELFEAVYSDRGLGFILKQVEKFHSDWSNFKRASVAA